MYNSESNILTKLFTIEYSIWFEYLLHGLSILKYPVPLGGTSNHFKTNILRSIGGWDAYNVTEDAELGMRLYLRGYKSYILNSYTFEEAPISFSIWLNQRARWIKGFFQTFLIFRNNNKKSYRLTRMQIFVTYIFIGVSSYNFFCLPWLILMILNNTNNVMNYLWLVNSFFSFSYTYATAFYSIKAKKEKIQQFSLMDYIAIILYPFYSILHSIASYKAMFEIITNPFKWNKTPHGVVQKKK